jgi:hypothetical protein
MYRLVRELILRLRVTTLAKTLKAGNGSRLRQPAAGAQAAELSSPRQSVVTQTPVRRRVNCLPSRINPNRSQRP